MAAGNTTVQTPPFGRPAMLVRPLDIRTVAPIAALVVLALLVIMPLVVMLIASFRPANVYPFEGTAFTFDNYLEVFTSPTILPLLQTTVVYSAAGIIIGLPIAFGLAFLTERTDLPLRSWMYTLMFIPLSTPPFATALGWVLLLG
ncbi:MAG: hypothetical protein AAB289_06585, partial [Chloroflexota bacterium]